ncbi:sensor histidine kinase [Belliella kenyensis]|uniref:Sensor histidine kinase n=1 Tax=Belliella kenyensis TaxID=1472724 RepID=A0ABV8ENT9_9BACT|nr:histidine kinase [Belliella kenyensis]MCH7403588.1 histidine kinase [Belliella kenyensis]MDN3603860.1 histidine kinase [Belliella kenyensis]
MKIQSDYKQNLSLLTHVLGWALFGLVIFILSPLSAGVERPIEFWIKQSLNFSLLIFMFYINYFYFIPKILFKNKIPLFLFINLIAGMGCILLLIAYDDWVNMQELMHKAYRPDTPYRPKPRNYYWDISQLLVFFMVIGISTSVAAVQKWQADEALRLEQKRQQIDSELNYLKAQINPHFFFNTLNNIYSLTNIDIEKSKSALLKLSRMMRYVLYETEKSNTLLSKEIDFVLDFVELMKIRLSSKVKLNISIPEKYQDSPIAPMLLLPFIENCFKHGISSQHESHIFIGIEITDQTLILTTKNSIFNTNERTPEGKDSGIGLQNTKRRLDLLYDNKYELKIDSQNQHSTYNVLLKIDLR